MLPRNDRPFVSLNMAGSRAREILPSMWETLAGFPLINLSWAHIAVRFIAIELVVANQSYHHESMVKVVFVLQRAHKTCGELHWECEHAKKIRL